MTSRSVIDGARVGMEVHPLYRDDPYAAKDYVPPEVLRTPAEGRPVPLPRSDLKPQLDLSPADLARVQEAKPGAAGARGGSTGPRPLTVVEWRSAPDPAPGLVFGAGFQRGETRARILHFLEHAPPGAAYTCEEITRALYQDGTGPARSAVNSQCYHYKEWMPQVETRKLAVPHGRISQYRWRQDHPWPPLPEGARLMTDGPSHRVQSATRRRTPAGRAEAQS